MNVVSKRHGIQKKKRSKNPSSPQFYHQVASPRVKNSGQIRICVLLVVSLMAGKELEVDTQVSVPDKVSVRRVK